MPASRAGIQELMAEIILTDKSSLKIVRFSPGFPPEFIRLRRAEMTNKETHFKFQKLFLC